MTWTTSQGSFTLKTPSDIFCMALFDYGYNPERSLQKYMFSQMCSHLGPQGSPHMILSAFVVVRLKREDTSRDL